MRLLRRNLRPYYYALYKAHEPVLDEQGHRTGESKVTYKTPVRARANISATSGRAEAELFGDFLNYDRVMITDDMNCPVDEQSVLCIDNCPAYDSEGNFVYDHIVRRRAEHLNVIVFALSKVEP